MEILWSYEHEIALKWLKFTNRAICFLAGIGLLKASVDPNQPELIAVGSFIGFMKLLKCLVCNGADEITTYALCLQHCMFSSWFLRSFLSLQSAQEARSKSSQTELLFPLILAERLAQCCWAHTPAETIPVAFEGLTFISLQNSSSSLVALSFQEKVCWPKALDPVEAGGSRVACVAHSCQREKLTFWYPPSLS